MLWLCAGPFGSLAAALRFANNDDTIFVSGLIQEDRLEIRNTRLLISALAGSSQTLVDCRGRGGFISASKSHLGLSGFTIRNCNTTADGGAIFASSTTLTFNDVVFEWNHAHRGAALFASDSTVILQNSVFRQNKAIEAGGAIFADDSSISFSGANKIHCNFVESTNLASSDVACSNCQLKDCPAFFRPPWVHGSSPDSFRLLSLSSLSCVGSNDISPSLQGYLFCGKAPDCAPPPLLPCNQNSTFSTLNQTCWDKVCDPRSESCLNCPGDCPTCSFNGAKVTFYANCSTSDILSPECVVDISSLSGSKIGLNNYLPGAVCPASAVIEAYMSLANTSQVQFSLEGVNVGAKLELRQVAAFDSPTSMKIIDSWFRSPSIATKATNLLPRGVYKLTLSVFSFSTTRSVALTIQADGQEVVPFYNLNVCGDQIFDPEEESGHTFACLSDWQLHLQNNNNNATNTSIPTPTKPNCGDGECTVDEDVSNCFVDCHPKLFTTCPPILQPQGHIQPGIPVRDDTMGSLIKNQMLWHLPGLTHMTFGVNMFTGEEQTTPLFYFGYCNETTQVVQDAYRANVYTIPKEITAQPTPLCTFDVSTKQYSSSSAIASEMTKASSMNVDASISVQFGRIGGGVEFSYAQEKSVQTARSFEQKRSGETFVSELACVTSRVQLQKHSWHPIFLKRIAAVRHIREMESIVEDFGTHFYTQASLGGQLKQISIVSEEILSTRTQQQIVDHSELAFAASASAPMFSVSGGYGQSLDTEMSSESQTDFEEKTSRSTLQTKGGAPGSFGPSSDADFSTWASSIDLLPVPVNFKLGQVMDLLKKEPWEINIETDLRYNEETQDLEPYQPPTTTRTYPVWRAWQIGWFLHVNRTLQLLQESLNPSTGPKLYTYDIVIVPTQKFLRIDDQPPRSSQPEPYCVHLDNYADSPIHLDTLDIDVSGFESCQANAQLSTASLRGVVLKLDDLAYPLLDRDPGNFVRSFVGPEAFYLSLRPGERLLPRNLDETNLLPTTYHPFLTSKQVMSFVHTARSPLPSLTAASYTDVDGYTFMESNPYELSPDYTIVINRAEGTAVYAPTSSGGKSSNFANQDWQYKDMTFLWYRVRQIDTGKYFVWPGSPDRMGLAQGYSAKILPFSVETEFICTNGAMTITDSILNWPCEKTVTPEMTYWNPTTTPLPYFKENVGGPWAAIGDPVSLNMVVGANRYDLGHLFQATGPDGSVDWQPAPSNDTAMLFEISDVYFLKSYSGQGHFNVWTHKAAKRFVVGETLSLPLTPLVPKVSLLFK